MGAFVRYGILRSKPHILRKLTEPLANISLAKSEGPGVHNGQTTYSASDSRLETDSVTFRPKPNWFLIRATPLGILALLIFAVARGASFLGLMFIFGVALLWLVSRSSSMTLDNEGFTYQSLGARSTSHRWSDIEAFYVVEQKALGLIPTNRYLGWNYLPEYKRRGRKVTRAVAQWVGMTEEMIKPLGLNIRELVPVMNEHLARARGNGNQTSAPIA